MERTRHTEYQKKYRKKVHDKQKTALDFMKYVENKAPWLVLDFFVEKMVIFAVLVPS